ncbi:MAG: tripartite tricarboxylate transporter permease [Deltaproteobacteria bacterium]|nr:tripartite tricarboxylate transporter permease [Deltaproteobacteria bacterium]
MDAVFSIITSLFQWQNLAALIGGTISGIIIGVLPGLGPSAGMALALPFVLKWDPATALIFIGALFKCSNYGGSITAILVNTPGDAANAATILDGYPMCEKGRAGIALGLSATGAMVGGTLGMICLIFAAPFLARFALKFGAAEYFWVAVFALSIIAASVKGATIKGIISGGMGLMISTVGTDVITGHERFTFGWAAIADGIPFIPVLVGLFAVTQALVLAEWAESISRIGRVAGGFWEGVTTYFKHPFAAMRSAAIGLFIGVLPAVGMSSAGLLSWAEAKRESKHQETFGTGEPEGVIASETATNACMPGDLVCTVALGVPGSIGAAIFLGIMIVFGVVPGPLVFTEKADIIYSVFAAMVVTSFLLFLVGMTVARHLVVVTLLPNEIIVPAILVVSLLGSFAINYSMSDVVISLAFGAIGYIMLKGGFTPVPLLLGLVLGHMVESNYHRALLLSRGSYSIFFSSAISKFLIFLTILSLIIPYLGLLWEKMTRREK